VLFPEARSTRGGCARVVTARAMRPRRSDGARVHGQERYGAVPCRIQQAEGNFCNCRCLIGARSATCTALVVTDGDRKRPDGGDAPHTGTYRHPDKWLPLQSPATTTVMPGSSFTCSDECCHCCLLGRVLCLGAVADVVALPRRCHGDANRSSLPVRGGEDGCREARGWRLGGDVQRLQLGEQCLGNKPHGSASPSCIHIRGTAAACPSSLPSHRNRRRERAVSITWPPAKTSASAKRAVGLCHIHVLPQSPQSPEAVSGSTRSTRTQVL
jgi:hypothetical protein